MGKRKITSASSAALAASVFMIITSVVSVIIMVSAPFNTYWQKLVFSVGTGALLGGIAAVAIRSVFGGERKHGKFRDSEYYWPCMAALMTLVCFFLAFTFVGIWPFGKRTVMTVDLYHQYGPLLQLHSEVLGELRSFLYSWNMGLGGSYIPTAAYYLASPFNFILVLMPDNLMAEGVYIIVLLKVALSGGFMAACVQYMFRRKGLVCVIPGMLYGCMMYYFAYFWNIMWLDGVMMLPLIVMLFTRMTRTGKWGWYTAALAYTLFVNYYIGFMVCVFLVLYALHYAAAEIKTGKKFFRDASRFAIGSLFAGLIAAVILVPVVFSLGATSAAGEKLPVFNTEMTLFTFLNRLFCDLGPTIRSGNPPNIYCGIMGALLLPMYLMCSEVPLRRKVSRSVLLAVLGLSMTLNIPNLVWHGLHTPNDLPYRFSFVFCFVLILMGAEALTHYRSFTPKQVGAAVAFWSVLAVMAEHLDTEDRIHFGAVYAAIAMACVYLALAGAFASSRDEKSRRLVCWGVLAAVCIELVGGGAAQISVVNYNEVLTEHAYYVDSDTSKGMAEAVEYLQEEVAEEGDFYRMETLPRLTCVDTSLYDYPGMTIFASSSSQGITNFMRDLGMASNGVNSYMYRSSVPVMDSIFGIKYLVRRYDQAPPQDMELLETYKYGAYDFEIYENPDALDLGVAVSKNIHGWNPVSGNPINGLGSLVNKLTGKAANLFTSFSAEINEISKNYVNGTGGNYTIEVGGRDRTAVFNVKIPAGEQVYCWVKFRDAESVNITLGEEWTWYVTPWEPYIIAFPMSEKDVEATITVKTEATTSGRIVCSTLNKQAWDEALEVLRRNEFTVSEQTDTYVKGSVTADKDGYLFTTIPYDKGWSAWVDGEKVEVEDIKEAVVGLPITAGYHDIELRFEPQGFKIGLYATCGGLAVFALLMLLKKKFGKPEPAEETSGMETRFAVVNVRLGQAEEQAPAEPEVPAEPEEKPEETSPEDENA